MPTTLTATALYPDVAVYPSDTTYPSDSLYPGEIGFGEPTAAALTLTALTPASLTATGL